MTMYASNAGKSGGEFFTPSDVSELLTRIFHKPWIEIVQEKDKEILCTAIFHILAAHSGEKKDNWIAETKNIERWRGVIFS